MSRRRSALILVCAFAFAAVGFGLVSQVEWAAWLAFGLAAFGILGSTMELVAPSQLRLDPAGFTTWRPVRPRDVRTPWADCDRFETIQVSRRQKLVIYTVANPARSGRDEEIRLSTRYLAGGYGGLSAVQLADLMNGYRQRAIPGF